MADRLLDLACVSYLAAAQLLHVHAYPRANSGTVVNAIAASVAGDGPLTAVTAARAGLTVGLVTNRVGDDPAGHHLLAALTTAGVRHALHPDPDVPTPHLTVIADEDDTRTWFAALHHAYADLHHADLTPLAKARIGYIDCYQVLTDFAAHAITTAHGTGLVLNLGGDPLADTIADAAHGERVLAVQTSLDESDADDAEELATHLYERIRPDAAVVTLGRLGAIARTQHRRHRTSAPPGPVTHTHGAGASFSAGYIHALLVGGDTDAALRAGCEAGTTHCVTSAALAPHLLAQRPAA
ncbi:carbohydrate kinase family protein [Micromonospora sp. LOL_023]|uniref:carbohydrate kinase family protein n=1 Tax=Micromonospora sp. LOL_023 TaxID=3345418 RepID=UPI003A857F34